MCRGPSREPPILAFDVTPLASLECFPTFLSSYQNPTSPSQVLPLPQSLGPPPTSCTPHVHSACPHLHFLLAKQGHPALLASWSHWEGRGDDGQCRSCVCARHCSRCYACLHSLSSQQAPEKHIIISALQIRKQMHGDTQLKSSRARTWTQAVRPLSSPYWKKCYRNSRTIFSQTLLPQAFLQSTPQSTLSDQTLESTRLTLPWGAGPRITQPWDSSFPTNLPEPPAFLSTPPKHTSHLWLRNPGLQSGREARRAWGRTGSALCWPASGLGAEGWSRTVMYSHLLRGASLIANRIRFPYQALFFYLPSPAHHPPPASQPCPPCVLQLPQLIL